MELVKNRKNYQDQEDYKRALFMVSRWEFLKQKKLEFEIAANEKHERRAWVVSWIKLMTCFLYINSIYAEFCSCRHAKYMLLYKNRAAAKISREWRYYRSKLAPRGWMVGHENIEAESAAKRF